MSELRTVVKYGNRRLYDPTESRYVTLADLCTWVIDGAELSVIDADTKEDITCSVLFRVMSAQENRADPSMSRDFLLQAIRGGAGTASGMVATFLEQSLNLFPLLHADRDKTGAVHHESRAHAALDLAEVNYQRWCSARSQINEVVASVAREDTPESGRPATKAVPVSSRDLSRQLKRLPRQLGAGARR
jgi:polyhydroxyalkanoate synthesis repressor PhaR